MYIFFNYIYIYMLMTHSELELQSVGEITKHDRFKPDRRVSQRQPALSNPPILFSNYSVTLSAH